MIKKNSFLKRFTIFDLILISLMACLGIATKPIIVPLAHMITAPLFIPGGVIAGGFYMMWLVIGVAFVKKLGTGTLISLVQAIVVVAIGFFGTHGLMSFFTYIIPGLAVDFVYVFFKNKRISLTFCFLGGIAANVSGTFLVNLVFFRLPIIPLVLSLSTAGLSGGLGGIVAYSVVKKFKNKVLNYN